MRIQVPVTTTQTFVLATTAHYDLVAAWLSAVPAPVLLQRGIASWTGTRNQRRITITAPPMTTDFDTDVFLTPLPVEP